MSALARIPPPAPPAVVDAGRLARRRRAALRARGRSDNHDWFRNIASARFVLRRAFRIIEEHARAAGLDPLAHQALIQVYGSAANSLRVKDLADRLDISQAFASGLIGTLVGRGLVQRQRGATDLREIRLAATPAGIALLTRIDAAVQTEVDAFTASLPADEKEAALSILTFYVGVALADPAAALQG